MCFSVFMVGIFIYFRFYHCCDESRLTHFCDPSFLFCAQISFFSFCDKLCLFVTVRIFFFSFDGKIFCPHFIAFWGQDNLFSHFCWRHFLNFLFSLRVGLSPPGDRQRCKAPGSIFSTSPNDKHVLQKCLQTANVSFSTKIKTHDKSEVTRGRGCPSTTIFQRIFLKNCGAEQLYQTCHQIIFP